MWSLVQPLAAGHVHPPLWASVSSTEKSGYRHRSWLWDSGPVPSTCKPDWSNDCFNERSLWLLFFPVPSTFSNKSVKFCKRGGMEKALFVSDHTWGPEFASQNPCQTPCAVACARHPSNGRMGGRDRLVPARNPSWLARFQANERLRLNERNNFWGCPLTITCISSHVYPYTREGEQTHNSQGTPHPLLLLNRKTTSLTINVNSLERFGKEQTTYWEESCLSSWKSICPWKHLVHMAGAGGELLSIYSPVKEQQPKNLWPCDGMK